MVKDNTRSPWDTVLPTLRQLVPEGHDQSLRNAFYNVAALTFTAIVAAAAWCVYVIFQPFLKALLWAVLCGSLLHPVKSTLTLRATNWARECIASDRLLVVSTLLVPLHILDHVSELIGRFVLKHLRSLSLVSLMLPMAYFATHHMPTNLSISFEAIVSFSYSAVTFVVTSVHQQSYLVVSFITAYALAVAVGVNYVSGKILRRMSVPVWVLALALVANWLPVGAVAIFLAMCLLLFVGVGIEVKEFHARQCDRDAQVTMISSILYVCLGWKTGQLCTPIKTEPQVEEISEKETVVSKDCPVELTHETDVTCESEKIAPESVTDGAKIDETQSVKTDPFRTPSRMTETLQPLRPKVASTKHLQADDCDWYLKVVCFACCLVGLWHHNYLMPLLPLALFYYIFKKFISEYLTLKMWKDAFSSLVSKIPLKEHILRGFHEREDFLFPTPIRGVLKLMVESDHYALAAISVSLDALVTIFVMMLVIVLSIVGVVFLVIQIQGESMHIIALGSEVINATVVNNPQILALLPDGLEDVMSSALGNAYLYGREWIVNVIRGLFGEKDDVQAALLEKQILELWDHAYQAWLMSHPPELTVGPMVTSDAVALSFDSVVDLLYNTPDLIHLSSLSEMVRNNLSTVMNVLDSVWAILKGNISLVFSALTASLSILLGGSLSLLNALINLVVFMSALFYLLSSSSSTYKPVALMTSMAPGPMSRLGTAVEDAVNGVFIASLKMGIFYGMWTWLLHSVFPTNIVYIPAVLATLFGAVPLVGTYWAAVPGAVELCWHQGSMTMAAALFVCQVLPMSCVDTAIYSQIRGGGHPYLTGLAVAGGVFCWGPGGAILGPLLLCILLVAVNMFTTVIQTPPPISAKFPRFQW